MEGEKTALSLSHLPPDVGQRGPLPPGSVPRAPQRDEASSAGSSSSSSNSRRMRGGGGAAGGGRGRGRRQPLLAPGGVKGGALLSVKPVRHPPAPRALPAPGGGPPPGDRVDVGVGRAQGVTRRGAGLGGQRRRRRGGGGRGRGRRGVGERAARPEPRRPPGLGHPRRLPLLLPGPVPDPVEGEHVVLLGLGEVVGRGRGGDGGGGGRKGRGATAAAEEERGHGGGGRGRCRRCGKPDDYIEPSLALPPGATAPRQRAEREDGSRGPHGRGGARRGCG